MNLRRTVQGSILSLHCQRPRLHFDTLKLLNFDFNADPDLDPAFPSNADPDPASKINAEPDLQPWIGWMKPERKANTIMRMRP